MRALVILLSLLAGCATVVRDLPPEAPPAEDAALLAGRLEFSRLQLRSRDDRLYLVRPEGEVFLVAVPPGPYDVQAFGVYRPEYDTLAIEAVAGRTRYIGSFRPARDEHGDLRVVVRDELDAVAAAIAKRYGEREIERGLVQSSLEPLAEGDLVVAVYRPESYPYYSGYTGFSSYWYFAPYCRPPYRRPVRGR